MVPERIIGQLKKGKYFLVKWKNLDYVNCTWEHLDFIIKKCDYLRTEFIKVIETEKYLNYSIEERLELMRGRE